MLRTLSLVVTLLAAVASAGRQPALMRAGDAVVINETPCEACSDLLAMLQKRLEDPTSQQQLMQYILQDVCPQLPEQTRTQCSIFAPLVVASAVGWVREQSPVTICTRLALCPDTVQDILKMTVQDLYVQTFMRSPAVNRTLEAALRHTRAQPANDDCDTCKIAVVEMATILADPDTQKQLLEYAKDACGTFPAFHDQCVAYVETYGPVVMATAIAYLQPALCENIGFCPAPVPPQLRAQPQMLVRA